MQNDDYVPFADRGPNCIPNTPNEDAIICRALSLLPFEDVGDWLSGFSAEASPAKAETCGVAVRSMTEEFDSQSASGRLMMTLLSGFVTHEREVIRERSMAGTRRKAEAGAWLGGVVPYPVSRLTPATDDGECALCPGQAHPPRRWPIAAADRTASRRRVATQTALPAQR
jgi:hypothetical protein